MRQSQTQGRVLSGPEGPLPINVKNLTPADTPKTIKTYIYMYVLFKATIRILGLGVTYFMDAL